MASKPTPKPVPMNKMTPDQLFKKYGNSNKFDETPVVKAPPAAKKAAIEKAKQAVTSKIPKAISH